MKLLEKIKIEKSSSKKIFLSQKYVIKK